MSSKIVFNSAELACMHEAGHAEVALSVGARVIEIELYRQEPRSYGRTRVCRTDEQRPLIALGGFAAEYLLFKAGRLIKQDGQPPSEKEFIDYAIGNASEDRINFFRADHSGPDGFWPEGLDLKFMNYAIGRANEYMCLDLIERVAGALLKSGKLNEAEIQQIIAADPSL